MPLQPNRLAQPKSGGTPPDRRPKSVMVVSHERSGTHFLINAISTAYGFPPKHYLSLDPALLLINFYVPRTLANVVAEAAKKRPNSIIKSHHAVAFFDGVIDDILKETLVFYIHRHPVDVMISFWRYVHSNRWREGPKPDDAVAFAGAEPEGQMLRYQMHQRPTILHRWAAHVDGWLAAAAIRPRLIPVRYDDLNREYEKTITGFAPLFGTQPANLIRPARDRDVIAGRPKTALAEPDRDALAELARTHVGDTMRRLHYD